jgi:hypothetical protein
LHFKLTLSLPRLQYENNFLAETGGYMDAGAGSQWGAYVAGGYTQPRGGYSGGYGDYADPAVGGYSQSAGGYAQPTDSGAVPPPQ